MYKKIGLVLILVIAFCSVPSMKISSAEDLKSARGPVDEGLELDSMLDEADAKNSTLSSAPKPLSSVPSSLELDGPNEDLAGLLEDGGTNSGAKTESRKPAEGAQGDDLGSLEDALESSGPETANSPPAKAPTVISPPSAPAADTSASPASGLNAITNLEFKTEPGTVRIVITSQRRLRYKQVQAGISKQHVFIFENTTVPERLQRAYDTSEFAGSVQLFTLLQVPNSQPLSSKLIVQLRADQTPNVNPTDRGLTIDYPVNQMPDLDIVSQRADDLLNNDNIYASNQKYRGESIKRLEIKDAEVADVLRLIAKNSGYSIVVGDDVAGKVGTMSLENIPWDQAFTLLLQSKRLGYVKDGKILRVATLANLRSEREEAANMEAARRRIDPLKTVLIPISFAKVADMNARVKSMLGERGALDADPRTNTLIVKDISTNVERIQKLIASLDVPPATVSVTGKLVEVSHSFTKKMGFSNLGLSTALGGINLSQALNLSVGGSSVTSISIPSAANLNAKLQLAELNQQGRTLASPSVSVLANQTGTVRQSISFFIPAGDVTAGAGGGTTTPGVATVSQARQVTASLLLSVTPVVAGDGTIFMTVRLNNETPSIQGINTTINQREVNTQVLIENGDTAVIGGMFQNTLNISNEGIPFFMHLPIVGSIFKSNSEVEARGEILVFLTARVTNAEQSLKRSM